jgi:hypothetical protein
MAGVGVPAAVEAEGAKAWPGVVQCAVRDVLSDVCRWQCGRTVAGDSGSLPGGGIADAGLGVLRELASAPPTVHRAHSSVRQSRSPAARDRVVASSCVTPAERARRVPRSREIVWRVGHARAGARWGLSSPVQCGQPHRTRTADTRFRLIPPSRRLATGKKLGWTSLCGTSQLGWCVPEREWDDPPLGHPTLSWDAPGG